LKLNQDSETSSDKSTEIESEIDFNFQGLVTEIDFILFEVEIELRCIVLFVDFIKVVIYCSQCTFYEFLLHIFIYIDTVVI
jgi:hypothetical protein